MAKRRSRRSASCGTSMSKTSSKKLLEKIGATVLGLAAGTVINNFLSKKDVNGSDIMGLSGDTSGYIAPAIVAAAGVFGVSFAKRNDFIKQACIGLAAAGGASLVNKVTNRTIVSLSGDDTVAPIPGVGAIEYQQLPENNELMTSYNPNLQPIGDVDKQGYEVSDEVAVDATAPESINGVEEANIM